MNTGLYAGVGPYLTHYDVDVAGLALSRRDTVKLPGNIQYIWPHASQPCLYVASSSRISRDAVGSEHFLSVLAIDRASGRVTPFGTPVRLPHRPIHLTTDRHSANVLVAFNAPSDLHVYRIQRDGAIGEQVAQRQRARVSARFARYARQRTEQTRCGHHPHASERPHRLLRQSRACAGRPSRTESVDRRGQHLCGVFD